MKKVKVLLILLLLAGGLVAAGCGTGSSVVPPIFQINTDEFLTAVDDAAVNTAPLSNQATGTLDVANAQTNATVSASMAYTTNGNFAYGAAFSPTVSAFTVNPATGALTANGTKNGVNNNEDFAIFSLVVEPSNKFLIAADSSGTNGIEAFPINADGSLGTPAILVSQATLGATPHAIAVGAVGGQEVVAVALNASANNLVAFNVTPGVALTPGTLSKQTFAGTNFLTSVAFGSSGGAVIVLATSDAAAAGLASSVLTQVAAQASLAAPKTQTLCAAGGEVLGDGAGHVYVADNVNVRNVETFTMDGVGTFTPVSAGVNAGSTVAATGATCLRFDPSANEAFLYVGGAGGANNVNNISVFPLTNGVTLGTPVGQSLGAFLEELHILVTNGANGIAAF